MKRNRLCNILVFALCSLLFVPAYAEDSIAVEAPKKEKQPVYNCTQIKVDILSPVLTPALYNWQMQHYELAVNVRLAQRFYPTLEAGYTGGKMAQGDSISYSGQGGFFRVGADINPLKKHPESPHALLIGVRLGTAVQQSNHVISNGDTQKIGITGDCWGEIVAGCQVEIAEVRNTAFYMGWMGRIKFLFTRDKADITANDMKAIYIPGFGNRDNIGWGVNYYLGWKF